MLMQPVPPIVGKTTPLTEVQFRKLLRTTEVVEAARVALVRAEQQFAQAQQAQTDMVEVVLDAVGATGGAVRLQEGVVEFPVQADAQDETR